MNISITLVFFIYGLAFFSMGLAMLMESSRSPLLVQSRVLVPLAVFGLVHGIHEWLEMFLDKSAWFASQYPVQIAWLRVGVLTISFTSLAIFGLWLLQPERRLSTRDIFLWGGALVVYILLVFLISLFYRGRHGDLLAHLDANVRYLLAVPGAALAGITLYRHASQFTQQGQRNLAISLHWAAWGFIFYSLTQAVVPPIDVFPGNILNTASFLNITGMPIQIVRAAMAVIITLALIRATQVVEVERQREFQKIQQSRLDALEQVQRKLVEREAMRQELLRHIVIAQEDERARIARELHDETAQILTAFSLHLAALRDASSDDARFTEQVDHLQALSRQISQGIYRLVHDLRPAQLDDLGLVAALEYLAGEEQRRIGLHIHLEVIGSPQRLDPLVETVLFRVAQEALTNVSRHAGVQQAYIELHFSTQQVQMRVRDLGAGFELSQILSPPHGWGLAGMRERAESVGGQLRLQSSPGQGTVVEITVPSQGGKSWNPSA